MTAPVVAGLGSPYRHDDAVGPAVAAAVAAAVPGLAVAAPLGEPLDLLGRIDGAELAVVVDAVRSGAAPGTVTVITLADTPGHGGPAPTSGHGLGLADVVRLARALDRAPRRVVLVTVEGVRFDAGVGLSPAVVAAVEPATEAVLALLAAAPADQEVPACA